MVELWKSLGGRCYMATFTIRHHAGQRLATLHAGLMRAFKRFQQGREWMDFRDVCGGLQTIRAVEHTHGNNGWHPHLHVLFLAPRSLEDHRDVAAWLAVRTGDLQSWVWERWEACVRRELGAEHLPSFAHGVDIREAKRAEYIAKLGLELTNPGDSKRGGRSPFGLLEHAAEGDEASAALWREFVSHTHGARFLGWSRGLRPWRQLAELRAADEDEPEPELAGTVLPHEWDRMRDIPGFRPSILEAAEQGRLAHALDRWRAAARFYETGPPHHSPTVGGSA